jgi:hypothetical protein
MAKQVFSVRLDPEIIQNIRDYSKSHGFSVQQTLNLVFSKNNSKLNQHATYKMLGKNHPWAKFAGMDDTSQNEFEKIIKEKRVNSRILKEKRLNLQNIND